MSPLAARVVLTHITAMREGQPKRNGLARTPPDGPEGQGGQEIGRRPSPMLRPCLGGVAACAVCCAGPILGFLAAIGIGTALGVAVFGIAGLLIAMLAVGPHRAPTSRRGRLRRRQRCSRRGHAGEEVLMSDTAPVASAKRLLPLYDDSAAIACTIRSDEIPDRIAIVERMRAAMTSIERTETGLLLEFPRDAAIEADVRRFAVDEKRCCQFWGFAVLDGDHTIALRWDGPPTAAELLDRLDSLLRSDDPVESVQGFL